MAAKSYQSYEQTLKRILLRFRPKRSFEWGPGASTNEIASISSEVISVEHDPAYYGKVREYGNVQYKLIPSLDEYATEPRKHDKFNFFFIDGRNRQRCLLVAKERALEGAVVMIHDAERERYRDHINEYPFQAWTDEGSTATLTLDLKTYIETLDALSDMLVGGISK